MEGRFIVKNAGYALPLLPGLLLALPACSCRELRTAIRWRARSTSRCSVILASVAMGLKRGDRSMDGFLMMCKDP